MCSAIYYLMTNGGRTLIFLCGGRLAVSIPVNSSLYVPRGLDARGARQWKKRKIAGEKKIHYWLKLLYLLLLYLFICVCVMVIGSGLCCVAVLFPFFLSFFLGIYKSLSLVVCLPTYFFSSIFPHSLYASSSPFLSPCHVFALDIVRHL